MKLLSGNRVTILPNKAETSETESRRRENSLASLLRQLETISPEAICSKHHAVPRVTMTLEEAFHLAEASSRARFATDRNSSAVGRENVVWWLKEQILPDPAPIWTHSLVVNGTPDASLAAELQTETGL